MPADPSIEDLLNANWAAFREWKPLGDEWLRETARGMPPGFHRSLRAALLDTFLDQITEERKAPLQLRLVIDSGIIVTDAFGVGRGYTSTTPRLLESPFVKAYAPAEAWEEVPRIIRAKVRPDVKLEPALEHGQVVLRRVQRIDEASPASVRRAAALIGSHSPEDVGFLAVAFDTEADAVVSYDKRAYDALEEIERWTMRDGSQAILKYEAGTLSLGIASAAVSVMARAAEVLLAALLRTIAEVLAVVASIIDWVVTKSEEAFDKIPGWAWAAALGVGAAILAGLVLSEDFRAWVGRGLSKAAALAAMVVRAVVETARAIWNGLKELLAWLWVNLGKPLGKAALLAAGILLSNIDSLIRECETFSEASAGTPERS